MTCPITRKEDTEKVTKTPKQLIPCILHPPTPGGWRSFNIFRPCSHVGGKVEQKIDRQVGAGCAVIWMLGHLLCWRRSRVLRRRQ